MTNMYYFHHNTPQARESEAIELPEEVGGTLEVTGGGRLPYVIPLNTKNSEKRSHNYKTIIGSEDPCLQTITVYPEEL